MSQKQNIVVYSDRLLPASETFILNQSEGLPSFLPYYVGSRSVEGLKVPQDRKIVANGQGLLSKIRQTLSLLFTNNTGVGKLKDHVRALNPVLIQAHYGPSGVNALPLKRALNIPLFVYFHGIDATMTNHFAKQSLYTRHYLKYREQLKQEADLFICTSEFIRSKLIAQGFDSDKTITHYIGTELHNQEVLSLESREPIVLFVARLVEKKGGQYLIDAMSKVAAVMPNTELVIIGDGPLRHQLEKQASKQLKKYRFLGWQPPKEVKRWMQKARVFSVPSYTAESGDAEGFGMVFIEAQTVGTPVASFIHGGIPEAVHHGSTGLLAQERDTELLSKHIAKLLTDDELWQQFSYNGVKFVRENFDLNVQNTKLDNLYQVFLSRQYLVVK